MLLVLLPEDAGFAYPISMKVRGAILVQGQQQQAWSRGWLEGL